MCSHTLQPAPLKEGGPTRRAACCLGARQAQRGGGGGLVCGLARHRAHLSCPRQEACAALLDQYLRHVQSTAPRSTPQKSFGGVGVAFSPVCPPAEPPASGPSLVIDGRSLAYALEKHLEDRFLLLAKQCRAVLCCRSTPLQKSMVVKLVRSKLQAMTLAIGEPRAGFLAGAS